MAHRTPCVRDALLIDTTGECAAIPVGSAAWFAWLETAGSFVFEADGARYTARKERHHRGGWYWRAYRRRGGSLRRVYLGKSATLTYQRLRHALEALDSNAVLPRAVQADAHARQRHTPIMLSKLQPPHIASPIIARPQLLQRLNAIDGGVTLLSAPAGAGKTTTLALWCAWLEQHAYPVVWLSLDRGDNDAQRFWRSVAAAFGQRYPAFAGAAHAADSAEQTVALISNTLLAAPHTVTLVLDDYAAITDARIHSSLALLLEHLPARLHLVLATRAEPPLPLARLRARGCLHELRGADLAFEQAEVAALLDATPGISVAAETVAAFAAAGAGWAAGVRLAALGMREQPAHDWSAPSGSERCFSDYFAQEVFGPLPAAVQTFLLHTAVLDQLSAPLCDAVCAITGSAQMLAALQTANLLIEPLDAAHITYRYQRLWRGFLRATLERSDPGRAALLHRRAAAWLADNGRAGEALEHAVLGGDYASIAGMIEQHAAACFAAGHAATVLRAIHALPPTLPAERPRLALISVRALLLGGSWHELEARLRAWGRPGDHEAFETRLLYAVRMLLQGRIDDGSAVLERIAALLDPADIVLHSTYTMASAAAAWAHGDGQNAMQQLGRMRAGVAATPYTDIALLALSHEAQFLQARGRLHAAHARWRRVLEMVDAHAGADLPATGMAALGLGRLLYEWNDLDGAAACMQRAIDYGHRREEAGMVAAGLAGLASVSQARGELAAAAALLDRAEHALPSTASPADLYVMLGRAGLALAQGDPAAAAAIELAAPHSAIYLASLAESVQLMLARVRLAQGRVDESILLLEQLRQRSLDSERHGILVAVNAVIAVAQQIHGKPEAAAASLRRALMLSEAQGYLRSIVDLGGAARVVLQRVLGATPEAAYHRAVLAAYDTADQLAAPHAGYAALNEHERAVLRLLLGGAGNRDIARQLSLSESAVKKRLQRVYRKLGVATRTQAVARAHELNDPRMNVNGRE